MFFLKKKEIEETPEPKYTKEQDALRDLFTVAIDLEAFEGGRILSIERMEIDTPKEETIIFVLYKGQKDTEEFPFLISRKQHADLVNRFIKTTKTADSL